MNLTSASRVRHFLLGCFALGLLGALACSSDPAPGENLQGAASTTGGQPVCVAPAQACNGACADLANDPANCGVCGQACVVGQSCVSGVCTTTCAAPQTLCGAACADVTSNALHCGGCNIPCAAGQICQGSVCVTGSCAVGQALCAGACVDTTVDTTNCGGCGLACSAGQVCSAGVCMSLGTASATTGDFGVTTTGAGITSTGGGTMGAGTTGGDATTGFSANATTTSGGVGTTGAVSTGAGGATSGTSTTSTTGNAGTDERPWFSFFVTSLPGLQGECGALGCGGDLGGLSGADAICTRLAQAGNPGDTKTWRAFLSTSGMYGDMVQVDAIDRVGSGPWWDWHGRMLAPDVQSLGSTRPSGGDPALRVMFVDETGADIQSARNGEGQEDPDNHDSLTGSGDDGRLYTEEGSDGSATCQDWTSSTVHGTVPVGHAWPRQAGATEGNGAAWIQDHTVNGCEPSIDIGGGGGACQTCYGVGDGGGYGAFFCFALDATAPPQ